MGKTYKSYDEEFKKTLVTLYENGKKISELSREYGINESTIRPWIQKYGTITTSTGETTNNDEIKDNEKTSFSYVTNLKVTNNNIAEIVAMGRRRWKIENECFNEQKNGTFCISHLCSKNENALKIHYLFIQIAHIIRQLLEYGSLMLRAMKLGTKKEVSQHITQALTSGSITLKEIELGFQLRFE